MKKERKDFPEWMVTRKFIEQDGVCGNKYCNNPLSNGFHRHHKDGDPSNNSYENLVLLCPECHYALKAEQTKGHNPLKAHRELQRKAIEGILRAIGLVEQGKLSGASLERLLQGWDRVLAESWKRVTFELEYPDPIFAMYKHLMRTGLIQNAYLEGFKDGLKALKGE